MYVENLSVRKIKLCISQIFDCGILSNLAPNLFSGYSTSTFKLSLAFFYQWSISKFSRFLVNLLKLNLLG